MACVGDARVVHSPLVWDYPIERQSLPNARSESGPLERAWLLRRDNPLSQRAKPDQWSRPGLSVY